MIYLSNSLIFLFFLITLFASSSKAPLILSNGYLKMFGYSTSLENKYRNLSWQCTITINKTLTFKGVTNLFKIRFII